MEFYRLNEQRDANMADGSFQRMEGICRMNLNLVQKKCNEFSLKDRLSFDIFDIFFLSVKTTDVPFVILASICKWARLKVYDVW